MDFLRAFIPDIMCDVQQANVASILFVVDQLSIFTSKAIFDVQEAKLRMRILEASVGFLSDYSEDLRNISITDNLPTETWMESMTSLIAPMHVMALKIALSIDANIDVLRGAGLETGELHIAQATDVPRAISEIMRVAQLLRSMVDERFERQKHILRSVCALPLVQASEEVDDMCTVCLEEFTAGQTLVMLPCHHMFHPKCIVPWLVKNPSCPADRNSIME